MATRKEKAVEDTRHSLVSRARLDVVPGHMQLVDRLRLDTLTADQLEALEELSSLIWGCGWSRGQEQPWGGGGDDA